VEAQDTRARGHATELCREAAREGYDGVVAFGGDGTVNEAVNGLAGSPTALTCLPGGSTNVYCRMLGIPDEVVDATEHLLHLADAWRPRRVDVGTANDRCFAFSSGVGLDASVVARVDAHPRLKARVGEYYFTYAAITTFMRRYLVAPPRLVVAIDGAAEVAGVTAIVQNAAPYTYFKRRRIEIADGPDMSDGTLSGAVLTRASPLDVPAILWRAFSRRAVVGRHPRVHTYRGAISVHVRSTDARPLPLQVDGDHVGEVPEVRYGVRGRTLAVVS
jgi:diacylglycerol kinase family enzyme